MKKILALALVMILALSLLTACGDNDNGNNGKGNDNKTTGGKTNSTTGNNDPKALTMSITVPDGWKESDSEIDKIQKEGFGTLIYVPDAEPGKYPLTLFSLTPHKNIFNKGEREYVENELKNEKTYFGEQNDYTDISEVTLGGHKALRFTKTHKDMGLFSVYTYIHKGDYVYIVQQSTYQEFMGDLSKDFDAMYASFTLK